MATENRFPMVFRQHIFVRRLEEEMEEHLQKPEKHGLNTACEVALVYNLLGRADEAIALLERAIGTVKDHTKNDNLWFTYEYAVAYLCRLYRDHDRIARHAEMLAKIHDKPIVPVADRAEDYVMVMAENPTGLKEAEGKNQRWAIGSIAWSLMGLYYFAEIKAAGWPETDGFDAEEIEGWIARFLALAVEKIGK